MNAPASDATSSSLVPPHWEVPESFRLVSSTTGMTAKTDGIYGIRVNHLLEVHVDGLAVSK